MDQGLQHKEQERQYGTNSRRNSVTGGVTVGQEGEQHIGGGTATQEEQQHRRNSNTGGTAIQEEQQHRRSIITGATATPEEETEG